jgi:putative thioredoxin
VQAGAAEASGPNLDEVAAAGAEALADGANEQAYAIFTEILGVDPEHGAALAGMLEALIALDRKEEAQTIHASLTQEQKAHPALERVGTMLAIAADREWNDGAARARLLEIFSMIGLEDPWVAATRRRLSAILFG